MTYKMRLYLSDKSYLRILYKIRKIVHNPTFIPKFWKDTKKIETNCGLCNKKIFDRTKKRMRFKQRCPFDMRKIDICTCANDRCFYHCYIFQIKEYEKNGSFDVERMRKMVGERIRVATNMFFL
ncbi:MAG: hypothetical protein ACW98X_11490 [Promethearchaeota archaeon]|jgi:hypothetical protein